MTLAAGSEDTASETLEVVRRRWYFRHPLLVRITHWINAIVLFGLIMSGLQIFNAHPALYWGKVSHFDTPIFAINATEDEQPKGVTSIFGKAFDTTGWLGASGVADVDDTAFPGWATLPSQQDLATGRRWHFMFAWALVINGFIYLIYGLTKGRLLSRMTPTREQWRHFGRSIVDHLMLRFPRGDEAKSYNILQRLSYFVVIFMLLPLQILTGLTMSPAMNAAAPFLLDLFGGRQSARTIHFIIATLLVLFVIVHVAMVLASGVWNNLRSMISGWFVIDERPVPTHEDKAPS